MTEQQTMRNKAPEQILVPGELADQLRCRVVDLDCAPQEWPTSLPDRVSEDVLTFAGHIQALLRSGPGLAVVRFDTTNLGDHELTEAAWNLFTLIGEPTPQYNTGELVYPVEITRSTPEISHYSGSNSAGGFHTDGTLLPEQPQIAALLGLSAAEFGGETILMDGAELCRRLDAIDPAHVQELSRAHYIDVKGQTTGATTKQQRIVVRDENGFQLRYLRRYIEEGYTKIGEKQPAALVAAMDLFDQESTKEEVQTPVLLTRGVLLLWDNWRFLHGRLPFVEGNSHRRLRRMYARLRPALVGR